MPPSQVKTKATTTAVLKPSLIKYGSLDDLDSVNTSLRNAGRPNSPNPPSHNRKRNLSADFPLWHHNEPWNPVGAWWSQKKRRCSSSTDSADQGIRSPLWIPGLATAGRQKETQKKRRYSSSTDSTDQGRQSPPWAPGLATAVRLKETQKKRRDSSSTDSTDQGSQSPIWAPSLATAGRLKETNFAASEASLRPFSPILKCPLLIQVSSMNDCRGNRE